MEADGWGLEAEGFELSSNIALGLGVYCTVYVP